MIQQRQKEFSSWLYSHGHEAGNEVNSRYENSIIIRQQSRAACIQNVQHRECLFEWWDLRAIRIRDSTSNSFRLIKRKMAEFRPNERSRSISLYTTIITYNLPGSCHFPESSSLLLPIYFHLGGFFLFTSYYKRRREMKWTQLAGSPRPVFSSSALVILYSKRQE